MVPYLLICCFSVFISSVTTCLHWISPCLNYTKRFLYSWLSTNWNKELSPGFIWPTIEPYKERKELGQIPWGLRWCGVFKDMHERGWRRTAQGRWKHREGLWVYSEWDGKPVEGFGHISDLKWKCVDWNFLKIIP